MGKKCSELRCCVQSKNGSKCILEEFSFGLDLDILGVDCLWRSSRGAALFVLMFRFGFLSIWNVEVVSFGWILFS